MRGGEKVLLSLARLFPEAPIYTLLHVRGSLCPELERREIHTSFVQHLPDAARRYRHYLPLFPRAVARFDLSGYDLVVSSSHCVAKGVRVRRGATHLCYCHTPMRYVWDRYDDYFGPRRLAAPLRPFMRLVARWLRAWDVRTAAGVTRFAANSAYVAGRIARYYRREAEVLPPPVDVDFFTPDDRPAEYDLVVSALVPYKRLELVLEAYRGSGRPLRIVGQGPERARLEAQAPPVARFLGHVEDGELRELYRGARVVIMPGIEDFGIVPVEAMACGRPALVYAEGGGAESVVDGRTGVFFRSLEPGALRAAVDSLETMRFNRDTLRARAEVYSRQAFEERFQVFVTHALPQYQW
jgi:glycosyltransferase involved in cell wall biosynthesis